MGFKEDHPTKYCLAAPIVNAAEGLSGAVSDTSKGGVENKTLGLLGGFFKGAISLGLPVYTLHSLPILGPVAMVRSWRLKQHYDAIANDEHVEQGATAVGWGIIALALTHPDIYFLPYTLSTAAIEKLYTGVNMIISALQNIG